VAVLAVTHADCEELADRIRRILQQRGELSGPVLEGPGWGSDPRHYATADRVLLHASLRQGDWRLHNGSTGTVTDVTPEGLEVRLDDGEIALLPAWFVHGTQPNGDPNLSHAWARTVDGAQGGTWTQVHLLGTAALDRFKGYVGQSRGRQPTHTWNVTRTPVDDHGGLAPVERTAAEQVLMAMGREPTKTFASLRDPWVLDRALNAERRARTGHRHQAARTPTPADRRPRRQASR
jgi:ATP-dependent exoDNAse (exonuclease V) alpha subunit